MDEMKDSVTIRRASESLQPRVTGHSGGGGGGGGSAGGPSSGKPKGPPKKGTDGKPKKDKRLTSENDLAIDEAGRRLKVDLFLVSCRVYIRTYTSPCHHIIIYSHAGGDR